MSADEKETTTSQKKKHRSPAHPLIAIDDAIERLNLIYKKDKRAFTSFEAILEHLGYETKQRSGTSARVISALRQYGLLDERNKQFRVSDLGWKILEMEEGSEERDKLVKEAALNPPIIRQILQHYNGELPSDAALRSHLLFHAKFNPDSVAPFIRVLRRTVDIANPSPDDYNAGEESDGADQPQAGGTPMPQESSPLPGHIRPEMHRIVNQGRPGNTGYTPPEGQLHFPLYLSKDQKAALYVPANMSQREYELLKKQIENSLLVMEATAVAPDTKEEEGE